MLTALLQFFLSYSMALLAFWVLEISTFIFILFAFEYLASGHLFPLDMLPPPLKQILLFSRRFRINCIFRSVFIWARWRARSCGADWRCQLLWVVAAYGFARFMWRRGVRKYSAFGG